jgi:hypothetical protein
MSQPVGVPSRGTRDEATSRESLLGGRGDASESEPVRRKMQESVSRMGAAATLPCERGRQ